MLLSLATAINTDKTEYVPRELKLNYTTQTQLGLIGTEDLSCPGPWSQCQQCHSLTVVDSAVRCLMGTMFGQ